MDERITLGRLIESGHRVAALNTADLARLRATLARYADLTGYSAYDWTPGLGLHRIHSSAIPLPRTRTPYGALRHISGCRLPGIYLLCGFDNALTRTSVQRLLQDLARKRDATPRIAILAGNHLSVPKGICPGWEWQPRRAERSTVAPDAALNRY